MNEGFSEEIKKNQTSKLALKLADIFKKKREEWKDRDIKLRILSQFEQKSHLIISYFFQKKCEAVSRLKLPPDTSKDEKLIVGRTNARNSSTARRIYGEAAS